ncbi:hypothetical protein ACFWHR_07495 [Leucobacter sp. NPDC058333]|uniref:hypothetical protein n=1 Tax=Leucobacter sp. NPDC058333 TaxID=3346450 RepID=UPI00365C1E3A
MAGQMTLSKLEEAANENSTSLLALIERGDRVKLRDWVVSRSGSELAWMVLALGAGYLDREAESDMLQLSSGRLRRENATLEEANVNLFRERRELTEKVRELRQIIEARAAAAPANGRRVA